MKIGMSLAYSGEGFRETVDQLVELEKAGLDAIAVREAYTFDAISQIGYIAARTERLELASGIIQIYTRTPSLTAMTAAGLDYVSNGRFTLGIGASGPQVIEGFHGIKYDAPLGRTREIIDICRQVWRREKVQYSGKYYEVPLAPEKGTGLGKPLKLINHPVRADIPILLAALGPKNVQLAAELVQVWEPLFFHPGKAEEIWGESLAAGKAKRAPELGPLGISTAVGLAIGPGAGEMLQYVKPTMALYIGGMGAKDKNFYNQLMQRYGYVDEAEEIQNLYLAGKKDEAAAAVPDELAHAVSLVGSEDEVRTQLKQFAEAGVTQLNIMPLNPEHEAVKSQLETLKSLI
ncbi:LLM class F420-dependent oxidoreductase [Actinomycetospora corticicola]|uniref:F420-dependent oxidoreductase-like protein n=1 Tax=Actinomycetospora corticicola TaxID=663602 RepID=A0A7Y9J7V0_9PSEU|nr:F420-dependent oxidoreductase-like protein [Actinomycetospora corticicola]